MVEGCIEGSQIHSTEDVDKGFSIFANQILDDVPLVHGELEVLLHRVCINFIQLAVWSRSNLESVWSPGQGNIMVARESMGVKAG